MQRKVSHAIIDASPLPSKALGRIMALEFTEYDQRFEQFMSPLTTVVDALAQQLRVAPDPKNLEMKVRAAFHSSSYFTV